MTSKLLWREASLSCTRLHLDKRVNCVKSDGQSDLHLNKNPAVVPQDVQCYSLHYFTAKNDETMISLRHFQDIIHHHNTATEAAVVSIFNIWQIQIW